MPDSAQRSIEAVSRADFTWATLLSKMPEVPNASSIKLTEFGSTREHHTSTNSDIRQIAAAIHLSETFDSKLDESNWLRKPLFTASRGDMKDELTLPQILDSLSAPIATTTADGRIDLANKQFLDYFGMSIEALKDWETSGIVHPEDLPRVVSAWRESLEWGQPCELEQRLRRADGAYRWFHVRRLPLRDTQGRVVRWCMLLTDIDELKRVEDALTEHERESRIVVDTLPGLVCTFSASGEIEILNHRTLEYFGKTLEEMRHWQDDDVIHTEDLPRAIRLFTQAITSGEPLEYEARLRRFDAVYRWFQVRALPARDGTGRVVRWYTLVTDIDDLKHAEDALRTSEASLKLIVDTIPALAWSARPDGYCDFLNQRWLDYAGMTAQQAQGWGWASAIHPEDRKGLVEFWQSALTAGMPVETEGRMRRFDGSYRWFLFRAGPVRDAAGNIVKWYGSNIDIEDRKRVEEGLRASELSWRQIVDNIPGLVATMGATGEVEFLNRQTLDYFGKTNEELKNWSLIGVVHPDDLPRVIESRARSIESEQIYEIEHRCLGADGIYRWFQVRGLPVRNAEGAITAWYLLLTDIDARKRAEEEVKKSEGKLRQVVDAIPALAWCNLPDGSNEFLNQRWHDFTGLSPEESNGWGWQVAFHPEDLPQLMKKWEEMLASGESGEIEARLRRHDGAYRWFLIRAEPLRNEVGEIVRWYGTSTDIEDRRRTEAELRALKDQLYEENLVLRDEVDRTSMFEEIVGTSAALKPVLTRIAKVARTDSTVLVTGETGTGKELVARAIHRRSSRGARPFVSVNCAAVPRELIASELFGHEKGAFTGATNRRLGRFELAHGGTIFLDEVGELPMDTQVALLRVLQEREFERVGGSTSIRVDVRVIAATNRDLQRATESRAFRSDLFYRLNVFPIQVPALRERADDIPVLVGYFIDRYARKSGKTIRRVNKRTLDQLRSYPWPGNVRELQNVIERSMILCDTEEFKVDESWLPARPAIEGPVALSGAVAAHEKAVIEEALRASGGRVFGSSGAAARLGIPRSTLESKIRALKINKNQFRERPTSH